MPERYRQVDPEKMQKALTKNRWDIYELESRHVAPLRTLERMLQGEQCYREDVRNVEKALGLSPGALRPDTAQSSPLTIGEGSLSVYWAAPHGNFTRNRRVRDALGAEEFSVKLPEIIIQENERIEGKKLDDAGIRELCISAIKECHCLVGDLDRYGLDSAWEIGFAEARGLRVFGLTQDPGGSLDPRTANRRSYEQNFMHGWREHAVFRDVEELATHCTDKKVYICGSFRNEAALQVIRQSRLKEHAQKVIVPKDEINRTLGISSDHEITWKSSFRARKMAVDLLRESNVIVVLLPNYGMDTAWQIGFAEGHNLQVMGLVLSQVGGPSSEDLPFWAHWMHNWESKITVTSLEELIALLHGFLQRGFFSIPRT